MSAFSELNEVILLIQKKKKIFFFLFHQELSIDSPQIKASFQTFQAPKGTPLPTPFTISKEVRDGKQFNAGAPPIL